MLVHLDPVSSEPLYRQLRRAITEAIESGRFAAGELLPSSRVLAADLDLSRNTVNMAYQELVAEGFLESIPRVGYAVATCGGIWPSPLLRRQPRGSTGRSVSVNYPMTCRTS